MWGLYLESVTWDVPKYTKFVVAFRPPIIIIFLTLFYIIVLNKGSYVTLRGENVTQGLVGSQYFIVYYIKYY